MYERPLIAINRLTGERMQRPEYPHHLRYAHSSEWYPAYYRYVSAMKLWNAFIDRMPKTVPYERPKLIHATEKGVPVAGLRDGARRKYVNGSGVSANSRILPHRYADEGEKGKGHRREIRRKEETLWRDEWQQEENSDAFECDTAEWFGRNDWLYDEYEYDEYECEYCKGPCEL